jgi:hypothetical protein
MEWKEWNEFENQDVANLLSGISYTINRLKNKLTKKDYQALAGDIILLKNKILFGGRYSRYEDVSGLIPIIKNEKLKENK